MTTDTPTPRTDALIKERSRYVVFDDPEPMSMEEHARDLELELAAVHGLCAERFNEIEQLTRDLTACRAVLLEISEYWNGDRNDSAMFDALTHIDEVARAILPPVDQPGETK